MSTPLPRPLLLALLIAPAAPAHHSWAPYDLKQEVRLEGVVLEYKWANPHTYVQLQTTGAGGAIEVWEIEASSAVVMRNRGWSRSTLQVGDRVTVFANPSVSAGKTKALGARLRTQSGMEWEMRQANATAPAAVAPATGASSLAGLWRTVTPPTVREHFFFFEPSYWPLTANGKRAFENFADGDNPGKNCTPYASPFLMIIGDAKVITLGEQTVRLRTELENVEREIHMDVSTHDGVAPSVQGHSIGHWEGGVLVVHTARFAEHGMGNAQKLRSGPNKQLTERFALSDDGKQLHYSFELSDPDILAEPVRYEMDWVYSPDFAMIEMPCDADSAQRYLDIR